MYKIEEQFLKDLLRDFSRTIVGRLCKQNELLEKRKDLSELQKLTLLKEFNRELIYEHFRDLENAIKFHNQGKVYQKYDIYKKPPTT